MHDGGKKQTKTEVFITTNGLPDCHGHAFEPDLYRENLVNTDKLENCTDTEGAGSYIC